MGLLAVNAAESFGVVVWANSLALWHRKGNVSWSSLGQWMAKLLCMSLHHRRDSLSDPLSCHMPPALTILSMERAEHSQSDWVPTTRRRQLAM
eukprot:6306505-Amphidinium_carterae.2